MLNGEKLVAKMAQFFPNIIQLSLEDMQAVPMVTHPHTLSHTYIHTYSTYILLRV